MMKKIILNGIILLTINNLAYSQQINGEIIYKVSLNKSFTMMDKEKLKTMPPAYLDEIKRNIADLEQQIKSNINSIEMKLLFNNQEAVYTPIYGMDNEGDEGLETTMKIIGATGTYYFNKVQNKKIYQTSAYGQLFLVESNLDTRQWVLTQETKTINNYLCYKATSTLVTKNSAGTFNKPIIAWYAPKLAIPFGPIGYSGLPGLIMELAEGDYIFYINKLTINLKNPYKIERPTKGKIISEEEFEAIGLQSSPKFRN